jgi:hypothetical protein
MEMKISSLNKLINVREYLKTTWNKRILLIFLLLTLIISFYIPLLSFGRPFGTDEYTHLYHTKEMHSSTSLWDFYDEIGKKVSDPQNPDNLYNYPFGLWLFGAIIGKVTGLLPYSTAYLFPMVFLIVLFSVFYLYIGSFLNSKDQVLLAILFLLSMPHIALTLEGFRPSVFIIPFLLLSLYFAFKEKLSWKSIAIMWISVFMIAITHTGTFLFLISFSIVFFFAYGLIWGRFSKSMYILAASTLFIYVIAVNLFPHIYPQYADKSTLFLSPGNFLSSKLGLFFAEDLSQMLYKNLFIQKEYVYAIFWSGFIYIIGKLLLHLHSRFKKIKVVPQIIVLPIQKISHSLVATPFWIGPLQTLFSAIGFFRLDGKGKCLLLTALVTTLFPQWLQEFEGISGGTGALREIYYLIIAIPIASALGFWFILSKFKNSTRVGTLTLSAVLIVVFSSFILIPAIGNIYYNPQISGEDYIIKGMEWLGNFGSPNEKVVGYGYRTVPIYTNKMDATYGLKSGTETRIFTKLLRNIHFSNSEKDVQDFYSLYGVKYIITSSKIISNLGGSAEKVNINSNKALDKIYSSKDFGIYSSYKSSEIEGNIYFNENFAIKKIGSNIEIESESYKILLYENSPTIKYIGTSRQNYLEEGLMYELARISWLGGKKEFASYLFNEMTFSREIENNQIIYKKILQDESGNENWASLVVKYTFYPNTIKREYIISNDWLSFNEKVSMRVYFSTNLFSPFLKFVLKNDLQRVERNIYPSEDSVQINDIYQEIYLHDGNKGIYIKYDTTAPKPNYIYYKGSTKYNYSSIGLGQFEFLEPGTSLHITQYISIGNETIAKQRIEDQMGTALHLYPDGIIPIVLCGYQDRQALSSQNEYTTIRKNGISYTEAIDTSQFDLRSIVDMGINVIGYKSIKWKNYDNISTQEDKINTLIANAKNQNFTLKGFMPTSYSYNLDTIKVLRDKNLLFMVANPVNAPYSGFYEEGLRHPQMLQYQGNTTSIVLLPVSNPSSTALSYSDSSEIFMSWKSVIDLAVENDDLALFLWKSTDIENPQFTDGFLELIKYAKEKGLTFTTPDTIAEHYRKLQKILYNTHREIDFVSISITNENDELVQGVTFKVKMPKLKEGSYTVKNGRIAKIKESTDQLIIYASTDVEPHESKILIIEPDIERKHFNVELPKHPIEGQVLISVKDANNNPLPKATIIIDSTPYEANEDGTLQVELRRGTHQIIVNKPGYIKNTYELDVKGRIYLLRKFIDDIF